MATSRSRPEGADLSDSALDALIGDTATPEELGALFRRLQKPLAERILAGQLTARLGYAAGDAKPAEQANSRNGPSANTVLTRRAPCDRKSSMVRPPAPGRSPRHRRCPAPGR